MSSRAARSSQKQISPKRIELKCEGVAQLLRLMAHPGRLRILSHLAVSPRTVTELLDLCGASQSLTSQFLARMRSQGLVGCRRQGQHQVYFIADERVAGLLRSLEALFC